MSQIDYLPGFIITTEGDTLQGFINPGGSASQSQRCVFKTTLDEHWVKYSPDDLSGYGFQDGKYFVSKNIFLTKTDDIKVRNLDFDRKEGALKKPNDGTELYAPAPQETTYKHVFLEYLINGQADIFIYHESNASYYYVETENDSITQLPNSVELIKNQYNDDYIMDKKEYIGVLNYLMKDCPDIQKKTSSMMLNSKSLVKLAQYYHERTCDDGEACIVYEKNLRPKIALIPTYQFSSLSVSSAQYGKVLNYDFSNNSSWSAGVIVDLSELKQINNHLSIFTGILLEKQKLEPQTGETRIDYDIFQIPIGLRYLPITNKKIAPFIGLGLSNSYRYQVNVESQSPTNFLEIRKYHFSVIGHVGVNVQLSPNILVTTSLQYEQGRRFFQSRLDQSQNQALKVGIGLGYIF